MIGSDLIGILGIDSHFFGLIGTFPFEGGFFCPCCLSVTSCGCPGRACGDKYVSLNCFFPFPLPNPNCLLGFGGHSCSPAIVNQLDFRNYILRIQRRVEEVGRPGHDHFALSEAHTVIFWWLVLEWRVASQVTLGILLLCSWRS